MGNPAKIYDLDKKRQNKFKPNPEKVKQKTSEELAKIAKIDVSNCRTQVDYLNAIQAMLIGIIPIAEGLYREKPCQSNAYSLTNLLEKYQNISEQIQEQVDYEELGINLVNDLIKPLIESMVIELGSLFKDERSKLKSKKIADSFDRIFQNYGKVIQDKLVVLEKDIVKYME